MRGTVPNFFLKLGTVPILLTLVSCGFHLQGRTPLPDAFAYTFIDTKDEQTDFVQDLRKALLASGAKVIRTQASSGASRMPTTAACTICTRPQRDAVSCSAAARGASKIWLRSSPASPLRRLHA